VESLRRHAAKRRGDCVAEQLVHDACIPIEQ
jgi:hypothetical protein